MQFESTTLRFATEGNGDAIDLTAEVQGFVDSAGVVDGLAMSFVRGSTAAITTMEYEPGGVQDLKAMLERLIPSQGEYEHNRLNHDTNSHAHQRATVIGPSLSVPIVEGRLILGTWQQIVLLDFDDRARERAVVVQVFA
jgi:secondary thiamine-phosphate synthase enzyme